MPRRNTQEALIAMKIEILNSCLTKQMKCKDGAKLLHMHPKSFSRLKKRYLEGGVATLTPRPPGPKNGFLAGNRTPGWIEKIVCELAYKHTQTGPTELSEMLFDHYAIKLNQSTVFRILRRNHIRYYREYTKPKRAKPQLYCLETPGEEIQLDACIRSAEADNSAVLMPLMIVHVMCWARCIIEKPPRMLLISLNT